MIKKFLLLWLLATTTLGWAQQPSRPLPVLDAGDLAAETAAALSTLESARIATGVLLDRAVMVSDPHLYTGGFDSPVTTYAAWQQQYWQFYQSALDRSGLLTPEQLEANIQTRLQRGELPLLVLDYSYNELLPDAAAQGLIRIDSVNERVYDGPDRSRSPYTTGRVFVIAVPGYVHRSQTTSLYVGTEFYFGNAASPSSLYVNLGDNLGFRNVTMGSTVPLSSTSATQSSASASAAPNITVYNALEAAGANAVLRQGRPSVPPDMALSISATRTWPGSSPASAIAWVKWGRGNSSGKFRKPLVFVEGIDFPRYSGDPDDLALNYLVAYPPTSPGITNIPLNHPQFGVGYRQGEAGWNEMIEFNEEYPSLEKLPALRQALQEPANPQEQGYDIIYLDYTDGADVIQNNAMTLVDLLTHISNNRVPDGEETIVLGASMGGQVARFALAWMEQQNLCHNTKLYISFDSPHRGGNIVLGVQHMLDRLSGVSPFGGRFRDKREMLKRPASQQMLIYHYDADATTLRNGWQNWQNSPGSFPSHMRKVAVSNGDVTGRTLPNYHPGMMILRTTGIAPPGWGRNEAFALPGRSFKGDNNTVFAYRRPYGIRWHTKQVSPGTTPYDTSPGGTRTTAKTFNNENWLTRQYFDTGASIDTFIPLISALGITDAGSIGAANVNYNVQANIPESDRPNPSKYPFDAYFAPGTSEPHVQITNGQASSQGKPSYYSNNGAWVQNEMLESSHRLPTTLTSGYNYGSLFRRLLPSVTIAAGGILSINQTGLPVSGGTSATRVPPTDASFDLYTSACGSVVTVQQDGRFVVGNADGQRSATVRFGRGSLLDLRNRGLVTVHTGSVLRIQDGATLVVRNGSTLQNNGQIVIESGAFICIERGGSIQGQQPTYQSGVNSGANPTLGLGSLDCQAAPTPTCSPAWITLQKSTTAEVCIGSVVDISAISNNGAQVTAWRVDNGSLLSESPTGAMVQVGSYPGTTTIYADYTAAPGCPGSGTATTYINVVNQLYGQSCDQMRMANTPAAVYPNPADTYVDVRNPFTNDKPYHVELYNDRGRLLLSQTGRESVIHLETKVFPAGLYHIQVRQGKTMHRFNIAIQH